MSKNTKTVLILLAAAILIAVVPLFALKGAEFGGSDNAGSEMAAEINGEYEPGLLRCWKPRWEENCPARWKV